MVSPPQGITPEALARLKHLPLGDQTNHLLYLMLEPWFMGYWTFLGPKEKGIELADVLVLRGPVVFLFEAKTRETQESDLKWARGRILDAAKTINDRATMLREGGPVKLRNKWRGEVPFDPSTVSAYYGVVVLNHSSDPYDPRDIAPEAFRAPRIPVQVFSLEDLANLLRFIDTINDFLTYYELRARHSSAIAMPVHREGNTYASIVRRFPSLVADAAAGTIASSVAKHMQRFQESMTRVVAQPSAATRKDYERVAASYLPDYATFHAAGAADRDKVNRPVASDAHERAVSGLQIVSEMIRARRSDWGLAWVDAARSALRTRGDATAMGHTPERDLSFVALATRTLDAEREGLMFQMAQDALRAHSTGGVLVLSANPDKILWTFDHVRRYLRGKDEDLATEKVLDGSLAYYQRRM